MPRFLSTGNAVVDIMVRPVDGLRWGETALVESLRQSVGGNGANTAYALARLGNPVRLIASVGRDALGDFVVDYLRSGGVDTGGVRRSDAPTGATVGLVRSDGGRTFLHSLGASAGVLVSPEELARELPGCIHYHLAAPFRLTRMRPTMPDLLRTARAAGLTTSLDTQWDPEGRWLQDIGPCLPHTDYFFANEDEFRMLTGTGDPAEAAGILLRQGASTVVLKLEARGCAVYAGGAEIRCPALDVPVVDTTGAGDCFVAGFLHRAVRGAGLREAAEFANSIAARAIQSLGATEALRMAL